MILQGKTALVTGASGAIGRAIASAFARAGAALALSGLEPEPTEEVAAELRRSGAQAVAWPADLSRRGEAHKLATRVLEHFQGRLDVLVNNAGMSYKEPALDIAEQRFDYQMEVNFSAAFFLSQAAARAMAAHGGGRIVFISSTGAVAAHPHTAVYNAAKAALEGLTRSLAVEWGPLGIAVNAVEPGHIINGRDVLADATPERLAHWRAIPFGRAGLPDEVAHAVLFLASPQTTYLTGAVLRVDGGRGARSPIAVLSPP